MTYNHGIKVREKPTTLEQPKVALSAVQVIWGTAPVNQVENPPVNKPIILRSLEEAKRHFGYSKNFKEYTLCEAMYVNFEMLKVSPVVFVNVLDPAVHKKAVSDQEVLPINDAAILTAEGILLNTLKIKSNDGEKTFVRNTDYIASFDNNGHVLVTFLPNVITDSEPVKVTYDKLDPTLVKEDDIVGGYDAELNTFSGLELVKTIYPTLNVVPNLLVAPGYSHLPAVAAVLVAKSYQINGCFNATNVLDLVGKTKEKVIEYKEEHYLRDKSSILCWPKAFIKGETLNYSTIVAASYARRNADNDDIPYHSASNMKIGISGMVNEEGQEVFLDQLEANVLNAKGIVTAVNMGGWRTWGNNTASFDAEDSAIPDPKERFISIRRMFDWWGNSFVQNFFDSLDGPISYRLIESIVDEENIRANGYQARGVIAGAKITFNALENPMNAILNGKIKFKQKVGFFPPTEEIENELEFDPTFLAADLGGE